MANSYSISVQIEIGTNETKKNGVRDAVVLMLNNAKAAGNIVSATWNVREVPITEGGSI
jgi:hypothetical protein